MPRMPKKTTAQLADDVRRCRKALNEATYRPPPEIDVNEVAAKYGGLMAAVGALHRHGHD